MGSINERREEGGPVSIPQHRKNLWFKYKLESLFCRLLVCVCVCVEDIQQHGQPVSKIFPFFSLIVLHVQG